MDVELHRVEQVLHFVLLRNVAVDEVLVPSSDSNLQIEIFEFVNPESGPHVCGNATEMH